MPNRNRIISASQALFVGPTPATGSHWTGASDKLGPTVVKQLNRVQSVNFSYNVPRTPVHQFGELSFIDRPVLTSPTVSLGFSYLLSNAYNESALGLYISPSGSCLSGILNRVSDEKNYFLKLATEGVDAIGDTQNTMSGVTVGIGNGFLTSYEVGASVGAFPSVSVAVEGLNLTFDQGTSGNIIPAINPSDGSKITSWTYALPSARTNPTGTHSDMLISVLRPGDITFSFSERDGSSYDEPGLDVNNAPLQDFRLSFGLNREQLQKLGSRYSYSREPTYPIDVRLDLNAITTDITTGRIDDLICDDSTYDITVTLKRPLCSGAGAPAVVYYLRGAKLDNQAYSSNLGGNMTTSLSFMTQIGGPNATGTNLFISGQY